MTERVLFHGRAIGGPLDGQEINSRFPDGLIVVNVARKTSGIYRYADNKTFIYHEDQSYINNPTKLEQVANGADFDIRSL